MDSLAGKTILITGATDGLGKATAMEMARRGATILLHGRNPQKGNEMLKQINQLNDAAPHTYYNADFSSLHQVHHMAETITWEQRRLDILINNAGIGTSGRGSGRQTNEDGYELRFTVNYLAPYLLTHTLMPLLRQSTPAKIVNIVSAAQAPIDFEDVMLEKNYNGSRAYGQSKLALVMFTFTLADALQNHGITVNCLHPASQMDTNMVRQSNLPVHTALSEGLDTVMYVTLSPETEGLTGIYFDHHRQSRADQQAYDVEARNRLEALSRELTAIHSPVKPV